MRYMINPVKTAIAVVGVILLIVALVSCSTKEEVFEPVPFSFAADLVGEEVVVPELGLQISFPGSFLPLDSTGLDAFRNMMRGTDLYRDFYPVSPLVAITDTTKAGMIYVAQVDLAEMSTAAMAEKYEEFMKKYVDESAIIRHTYRINDLDVYHYLVHTGEVINHKLLGETSAGARYLIEYVISGRSYPLLEASVESSMASLKAAAAE